MNPQLTITLTPTGCNVQGCIDNKLVAFGMLELAKEAIAKHHESKGQAIVPASAADAAKLIKANGG